MTETKYVIIPVGFHALQCQSLLMPLLPLSYEWMNHFDFVKQYLYGADISPLEVWLMVWDVPTSRKSADAHPQPSEAAVIYNGLLVNLLWCKQQGRGIRVNVLHILPVTMKPGCSETPVKAMFPTAVDDIYSIDLQKQHENADPNMLVGEFIRKANEQAAAVILKAHHHSITQ